MSERYVFHFVPKKLAPSYIRTCLPEKDTTRCVLEVTGAAEWIPVLA